MQQEAVVCGDFNPTSLPSSFQEEMNNYNFNQEIRNSTHDKGNTLDYFFQRNLKVQQIFNHYIHFSDHDVICVQFNSKELSI